MTSSTQKEAINLIEGSQISRFASYHTKVGGNAPAVSEIVSNIQHRVPENELPDIFVGVGTSGAFLASVLSYVFNKPFLHIKKAHIDRYNNKIMSYAHMIGHVNNVISTFAGQKYWFVDDCIDSGITFWKAYHILTKHNALLSGIVLGVGYGIAEDSILELIYKIKDFTYIDTGSCKP